MLNFQARFILDAISLIPETFKDDLGFVIL